MLGAGHPVLHRFRLGLEFAVSGHKDLDEMIEHHSIMARALGEQLGLSEPALDALGASYEQWDGKGWPGELSGEKIPIAARLGAIGEFIGGCPPDRWHRGRQGACRKEGGKQFDPQLAAELEANADMSAGGPGGR